MGPEVLPANYALDDIRDGGAAGMRMLRCVVGLRRGSGKTVLLHNVSNPSPRFEDGTSRVCHLSLALSEDFAVFIVERYCHIGYRVRVLLVPFVLE